jgi:hypothetical protein
LSALSLPLAADYDLNDFNVLNKQNYEGDLRWICTTNLVYIENLIFFFIKVKVKNCVICKAVKCNCPLRPLLVMNRSSCGLMWGIKFGLCLDVSFLETLQSDSHYKDTITKI